MNLVPGTLVDRYRVESEIGRGGMARVYRVRHKNLNTVHALKVLTLAGEELAERLMREGRLQSSLDHPNIVAVRDVIELGDGHGLLMDFVEGPTLDGWLREEHPDSAERERVFLAIVGAVQFAHSKRVVHRDLKPGNVLMARRNGVWEPRVADFGLAKLVEGEDDVGQSRTGRPMGTPAYMAPEQVRSAKHVDHRADVFALGCILYELMCGRRAFTGTDSLEVFNQVAQGRFKPPTELVPGLPPRVERAILGALAVDADERIPTCDTLAQVFTGSVPWTPPARAGETLFDMGSVPDLPMDTGTLAGSLADPPPPASPRRRRPVLAGLAIAGLILLALGAVSVAVLRAANEGTSDAPQPTFLATDLAPEPAPTAPIAEPEPAPTAPIAAPEPVAPEPVVPADPVVVVPAPVAIEPTPVVAARPAPPTPPPARSGRIGFTGDADSVRLRGADGSIVQPGEVPPGSYLIEATFDDGGPLHAGSVVVRAGDRHTFDCRAATLSCSP